jgi:DNA repair exonuclease SbcCD ATPase subunit
MEEKEGNMLLKLAEDVEFLRKYIIHPNKDLEIRTKELQNINKKLREVVKILAEDRVIIKKELAERTNKLGAYRQKINFLEEKLLHKENSLKHLTKEMKALRDYIVSLRDKNIDLEVESKENFKRVELLGKKLQSETYDKKESVGKLLQAKNALENQVKLIKQEKDKQSLGAGELRDRMTKLLQVIEKQNKLMESVKLEFSKKIILQKKHYDCLMADLNQTHVRDTIDKKAMVLAMKKKIQELNAKLNQRRQKEQELAERFSEKIKEMFKD